MSNHVLKHDNKILQSILARTKELNHYHDLLSEHIDPNLAKHIQVVRFEKNCLFVIADNGTWATQLRYQIPDLMNQLKQHPELQHLSGIISKTRPSHSLSKASKKPPRVVRHLSRETAENILETAQTIKDKKLREILERIAGYLE